MSLGYSGLLSNPFVNSHTNIMGKERNYVCMSKVATQYLIFHSLPYERTLECFQDLKFRFDIQTEGLIINTVKLRVLTRVTNWKIGFLGVFIYEMWFYWHFTKEVEKSMIIFLFTMPFPCTCTCFFSFFQKYESDPTSDPTFFPPFFGNVNFSCYFYSAFIYAHKKSPKV